MQLQPYQINLSLLSRCYRAILLLMLLMSADIVKYLFFKTLPARNRFKCPGIQDKIQPCAKVLRDTSILMHAMCTHAGKYRA